MVIRAFVHLVKVGRQSFAADAGGKRPGNPYRIETFAEHLKIIIRVSASSMRKKDKCNENQMDPFTSGFTNLLKCYIFTFVKI